MALELLSLFLTKSAEFALGKVLDVAWDCLTCQDSHESRIGNVTTNNYYCSNCRSDHQQFTNACGETVSRIGRIGYVGCELSGGWHFITNGAILFPSAIGIQVPGTYVFDGLAGRSLVEKNQVIDYETKRVYSSENDLWNIKEDRDARSMSLKAMFEHLPSEKLHGQDLFILDYRVETAFGDILLHDRDIVKL